MPFAARRLAMSHYARITAALTLAALLCLVGCGPGDESGVVLTFPGSAVGSEREVLERQLERFMREHPGVEVRLRATPDAADSRHQLYVQWLNAHATDPDLLQLDVVWTAEFAAAGWLLPLDASELRAEEFFPGALEAGSWRDRLYAAPWFVDVGMLYWRTDLLDAPPTTLDQLEHASSRRGSLPYGFVWQGKRYEGLVCTFVEILGAFGGRVLDDAGNVTLDSPQAVAALEWLRDAVRDGRVSPESTLNWQEEEARFAFQNGEALFMRNWPYAFALLESDAASRVRGKFAVSPMPATANGSATATLGGQLLAVNARSDHPEEARQLIRFLTAPRQMLERALLTGQYPARRTIYDEAELADALSIPPATARQIIENATPRPVTPLYTQLSGVMQVELHRALTGQIEPRDALRSASRTMRDILRRFELLPEPDR